MLARLVRSRAAVVLAKLDLAVVAAEWRRTPEILVDARVRKYAPSADLRPLAHYAIGIGPGFVSQVSVDIAIETLPGHEGEIVTHGPTAAPTGKSVSLGGAREERFAYAVTSGPWRPWVTLGTRVQLDDPIGRLGQRLVTAPIEGCVRGIVRAMLGAVARGCKLVEIDPRIGAPWTGVPPRAQRIAEGVKKAVAAMLPVDPVLAFE